MDLKKVSEISAVAVPLLIVCSSIQLLTYYSNWNIPILDYLSTAEILFLFIRPLMTILLFAAVYVIFNLLFVGGATLYVVNARESEPKKSKAEERGDAKLEPVSMTKRILTILYYAGVLIVFPFFFFRGIWYDYEIFPVVLLHVGIWAAIALGIWYIRGNRDEQLPWEWALIAAIPVLLSASFFYGRYQAHYATAYPASQSVVLTDGSAVSTDANMLYVGKTSGYYFYYKVAEREAVIIPAAQIKAVTIKQAN